MTNQEEVTLFSPGPIPGIPGEHGPGRVLIDWDTRTVTPVEPAQQDVPPPAPVDAPQQ